MWPYGRFAERRPTFENVSPSTQQIVLSACFNSKLQDDDVIIDAKSSQVGLCPSLLVRYIGPFRLQDWRYSRTQHLYHWLIAAFESNSVSHYPLHLDQLSYRTPHQFLSPLLLAKLYCNRFIYISISDIIDSSHLNFDSRTKEEEEERRCLAFTSPQTSALMELMLIPFSLMPPELLLRLSEDLNTYVNLLFSFLHSFWFFFFKFLY